MTDKSFFVIWGNFLHFDPPNNPKNQNFEKMKKLPGNIIILHLCTTNDNHMMYVCWDIECDRIFVISDYFLPFYPLPPALTAQKTKIQIKMKKTPWNIIILFMSTKKDNQMMHGSWDREPDWRTDRWKKWHTEKGAPLKNNFMLFLHGYGPMDFTLSAPIT